MKRVVSSALFSTATVILGAANATALTTPPNTPTTSYDGSPIVQQIHIHGIVPTARYVYVNPQQKIVEVVGNTDDNSIVPRVVEADTYKNVALSPYINDQYQQILADNGGGLKAGLTYYPKSDPKFIDNQEITATSGVTILKSIDSLSI